MSFLILGMLVSKLRRDAVVIEHLRTEIQGRVFTMDIFSATMPMRRRGELIFRYGWADNYHVFLERVRAENAIWDSGQTVDSDPHYPTISIEAACFCALMKPEFPRKDLLVGILWEVIDDFTPPRIGEVSLGCGWQTFVQRAERDTDWSLFIWDAVSRLE